MSPAAIADHREAERIDVVEISPAVIEASRFFASENRGVLFDPRLELHFADARNFLIASRRRWDLIVSEPSNPWISGVANLFTREYFELTRSRLAPGGVVAQWFQGYGMSVDDVRTVIGTFAEVFPTVTIWSPQPGDLILVGSRGEHVLNARRLEALAARPELRGDLEVTGWRDGEAFVRMLLMDSTSAAAYGRDAPRNTDQRPRVEFNAPRNLYRETTFDNMLALIEQAGEGETVVPMSGLVEATGDRASALGLTAESLELEAELRVRWTALRSAEPQPLPTLGVGVRRLLRAATPGGSAPALEIEVLADPTEPDRPGLEERLRGLTDESVSGWSESRLADGTAVFRARLGERRTGLVWSCPESASGFPVYVAWLAGDPAPYEAGLACRHSGPR